MNFNLNPHTVYKNYLKIDHRFKYKTTKRLEENKGEHLQDLELDQEFLDMILKA